MTIIIGRPYSQIFLVCFNFKYSGLLWEKCELIFGLGNMVWKEYTVCNNFTLQQAFKLCVEMSGEDVMEQDRGPGSTTQSDISLNFSTCPAVATCSLCALGMLSSLFSLVILPFTFYFWEEAVGQVWPLHWSHSTWNLGLPVLYIILWVISTWEPMKEMSHVRALETSTWK